MSAQKTTPARTRTWALAACTALLVALTASTAARADDEPEHAPPATLGTVRIGDPVAHEGAAAKGEPKGEAGEEEESEELGEINWADFSNTKQPPLAIYIVNVGLLVLLLYKLVGPAIVTGLRDRRDRVAKDIEEAQKMKKEAEKRAKKYQAKLDHLDEDQAATKKALLEAGEADRKRIVREAEEKAARMERDARLLLEQETRQRRDDLARETVEAALAAAEDLLKKGMTHADQERLAEEFLFQLTSPPPAPPTPGGSSGAGGGGQRPSLSKDLRPAGIPPLAQTGGES